MKTYLINVSGDVQGVSYRYFARTEAENLQLSGYARNEQDGTVALLVQGNEENIKKFIRWAKNGSPMATVEMVEAKEVEFEGAIKGFEIQ